MADSQDAKSGDVFVVMHTAVSNFTRGARVTVDHLYHKNHPSRDAEFRRLQDLGAIKPESDPEAAALPVTYPAIGAAPIIMAGAENNLTPTLTARDDSIRQTLSGSIDYPGARADSTARRAPDGGVVAPESTAAPVAGLATVEAAPSGATEDATPIPASGPATTVVRTEPRGEAGRGRR